mmetsp:Transcript_19095/g.32756  ORF Transcript_19095/g.32756 Transcript_19095/m.32756 type:complete len:288 (+) Transcript_19095:138-1001(+)
MFEHTHILCRACPHSLLDALAKEVPEHPISLSQAVQEHAHMVQLLTGLVELGNFLEIPADEGCPDCVFIEDTALLVKLAGGGTAAVMTRPGADSRKPELGPVQEALQLQGFQAGSPNRPLYVLQAPATLDGGDVMYAGPAHGLWVGLSTRTNAAAVEQLKEILGPACPVHALQMEEGKALHLKSLVTMIAVNTALVADTAQGRALWALAKASPGAAEGLQCLMVPDMLCSNVVRIGQTVLFQAGYPESEAVVRQFCEARGLQLVCVSMAEFAKADGALTCCSLLWSF